MNKPNFEQIFNWIHLENPYDNFPLSDWPYDPFGFCANEHILKEIVRNKKPNLIIEVGSFQGSSAIAMAKELKELAEADLSFSPGIICVDTWLGAREFWTSDGDSGGWWNQMHLRVEQFRKEHYTKLRLKNGYPTLYYQFLANVLHNYCNDYILPFPQTSTIAARWFKSHEIEADMIYIDGSHDYEDVKQDLKLYWNVLEKGGLLVGDDYWISDVKQAVDEFGKENNLQLNHNNPYWWFEKP